MLVGLDPADDAAVYRISDELAIVQSIDFFTPIVDNPFAFGQIAATNALSDIYAMGATPIMALNVVAFSLEDLGHETLAEILQGGATAVTDAGAVVAGGHSVDDPEPKYGMVVTGIAHPERIFTKQGGKPGDALHLSKSIGGGLVTTAAKRGLADPALIERCIEVMTTRNDVAAVAAREADANALTDVTGFGLIGHLHEICESSGLSAEIDASSVPIIEGTDELAANPRCVSGGTKRNREYATDFVSWREDVGEDRRVLLSDAMTSGGLLATTPAGPDDPRLGPRIGALVEGEAGCIEVR